MDLKKSLNKVVNLNGYISFTQELVSTRNEIVVPFNMSTVLTLKRMRSFEVEYFSKLQQSGAAFMILERMLSFPPSKTWSLLSVEIVNLLNYWLEAVRKYIITSPGQSWWSFFKTVLRFITEIRPKDFSVSNLILKHSAVALLELSTSDKLTPEQRSQVVGCLNQVCFHSSRDMRVALQDHCAPYLVKLASDLAACRHVPTQFAIIELLLRWLPNRQERKVREAAAARWFPATLFKEETVAVFVERCFANFCKDARAFLNQHNSSSDDIISVVCRKLTVGRLELISLADKWDSWLDIVLSSGHLTAMLDLRRLPTLGLSPDLREHLTVTADNAQQVTVYRGPSQIQLSITTITQPQLTCNETQQLLDEQACDVNIWISTKCQFDTVDLALRKIFADKYKYDDNRRLSELIYSSDSNRHSASEEDTRFSHPIEIPKPRRAGCAVAPKRASGWKSPSTVSSTSLAYLTQKLSAIPKLKYDKEPTGICVAPDLSCVTEISEPDDDSNYTFSAKTRPCGVLKCPKTKPTIVNRAKTSPSDNEDAVSSKRKNVSPVIDVKRKFTTPVSEPAKRKSPMVKSETSPNCLLSAATFGAYEASIINDTLEGIQLDDDDEVINLLAQEAFAVKEKDVFQDSGINVSDKKTQSSAIETRANNQTLNKSKPTVACTVISKSSSEDTSASFQNVLSHNKSYLPANKGDNGSNVLKSTTTDESNTEAINETPVPFVDAKALILKGKKRARATSVDSKRNFKNVGQTDALNKTVIVTEDSPKQFAANDIEDFFSHHVQKNKNGDIFLSPTVARRVNETPSDTSDSFDRYLISNVGDRNHFQNITEFPDEENFVNPEDVFVCLNEIIDKVCEDLDKCAEYMEKEAKSPKTPIKITEQPVEIDSDFIPNTVSSTMNPSTKDKSPVKLAFKNAKAKKVPVKKNKRKTAKNPSPIKKAITPEVTQANGDIEPNNAKEVIPEPAKRVVAKNVPAKRKRKLYSPKDADKQSGINIPETEEDNSLSADVNSNIYTPKTAATSYKEIYKARNNRKLEPLYTRTTRKRGKASKSPPMSPRSMKKNEIFDKLKENVENVQIKQVGKRPKDRDLAVYNYTSESEDEDFKAKKTALQKTKGTPIGSTGSKRTTRSRVVNSESRNESSAGEGPVKKTVPKRKKAKQPAKPKKEVTKTIKTPIRDVIDERMRVATEGALNTSFVLHDIHENAHDSDLEPLSKLVKRMEPIPEVSIIEDDIVKDVVAPKKAPKKRCERVLSLKKDKNKQKINVDSSANEDTSPLPALIIEPVKTDKKDNDADSITSSKLIQRCEKVMEFGEDVDTTHNLLSDDDKVCSSQNLDTTNDDRIDICKDNTLKKEKAKQPTKEVSPTEDKLKLCKEAIVKIKREKAISQRIAPKPSSTAEVEVIEIIDDNVEAESPERSIATVGDSPIRAHGTLNEEPPNETMLKQQLTTPREVDYDMPTSMKNFFIQLCQEININPDKSKQLESPQVKVVKRVVTKRNAKTPVSQKQERVQSESGDDIVSDKSIEPESAPDKVAKSVVSKNNAKRAVTKKQAKEITQSKSEDDIVPDKNIKSPQEKVVRTQVSKQNAKKLIFRRKTYQARDIMQSDSEDNTNCDEIKGSPPEKVTKTVLKTVFSKKNVKIPVTKKQAKEIIQSLSEDDIVSDKNIEQESPQEKVVRTKVSKQNANAKKLIYRRKTYQAQDIMQSDSEDNTDCDEIKRSPPEKVTKTVLSKRNAKKPANTKVTAKRAEEIIQSETEDESDENVHYTSQIKEIRLSSPVVRPNVEKAASLLSITTSPTIVLKKLNLEDIRKWLPSPKSDLSDESREVFKVLNNTHKTVKSTDKIKAKVTKTVAPKTKRTPITNTSVNKLEQNNSNIDPGYTKAIPVRKSMISPIKDFDEIDPSEAIDIQSKSIATLTKLTSPLTKQKGLSNMRNINEAVAITSEISIGEEVTLLNTNFTTPATSESIDKGIVKAIERKRRMVAEVVEPKLKMTKKRRVDVEESVQSPATSVASNLQHSLDINMDPQRLCGEVREKSVLAECLQMILEKVNTTLIDMDHNTSKKMVAFFVEMHRRSQEFTKEFREFYNTKQAEHNRTMKAEAAALLRADSQRKLALMTMLREDIQAVLDHVQRSKD